MAKRSPAPLRRKLLTGRTANVWTSYLIKLDAAEEAVLRTLDTTGLSVSAVAQRHGVNAHSLSHWVAERRGPGHLKERSGRLQSERNQARRAGLSAPAPDLDAPSTPPLDIEHEVRRLRRDERTWSYVVHALRIDLHQIAAARAAYYDEGHQMGGQRGAA